MPEPVNHLPDRKPTAKDLATNAGDILPHLPYLQAKVERAIRSYLYPPLGAIPSHAACQSATALQRLYNHHTRTYAAELEAALLMHPGVSHP
jgi:hypothetical protein